MSKTETKLTINQKIAKLDEAVEWFYGDDFLIDEALEKYQQAKKLAEEISDDLTTLKNKIEIVEDFTKNVAA